MRYYCLEKFDIELDLIEIVESLIESYNYNFNVSTEFVCSHCIREGVALEDCSRYQFEQVRQIVAFLCVILYFAQVFSAFQGSGYLECNATVPPVNVKVERIVPDLSLLLFGNVAHFHPVSDEIR